GADLLGGHHRRPGHQDTPCPRHHRCPPGPHRPRTRSVVRFGDRRGSPRLGRDPAHPIQKGPSDRHRCRVLSPSLHLVIGAPRTTDSRVHRDRGTPRVWRTAPQPPLRLLRQPSLGGGPSRSQTRPTPDRRPCRFRRPTHSGDQRCGGRAPSPRSTGTSCTSRSVVFRRPKTALPVPSGLNVWTRALSTILSPSPHICSKLTWTRSLTPA